MTYVRDSLPKRTTGLPVLSALLIALVGLTVLGTFYLTHRSYDRVALAARPAGSSTALRSQERSPLARDWMDRTSICWTGKTKRTNG